MKTSPSRGATWGAQAAGYGAVLGSLLSLGQACTSTERQFRPEAGGDGGAELGGSPSASGSPNASGAPGVGGSSTAGDGGAAGGSEVGTGADGGSGSSSVAGDGAGGEPHASCDAPPTCEGDAVVSCSEDGSETKVACGGNKPICQGGVCRTPPSCTSLTSDCGADGDTSCCASPLLTGGKFFRSYDGVSSGFEDKSFPATVSNFRLDRFEVSVGRFREFVAAWVGGWRPASGAGKHSHLSGDGIALSAGGYELGWSNEWLSSASANYAAIPSTLADWNTALAPGTWTSGAGENEHLPITAVTWYESYAFCIWDGGFLPTEAEWNYAAAGGSQQRVYPWGSTAPGTDTSLANYNCLYGPGNCDPDGSLAPVGEAAAGVGRYGQLDLAGNAREWILDFYADYDVACTDCAQLTFAQARGYRGGSFYDTADQILASYRESYPPTYRSVRVGARCARSP
jgi:formylglycine-generating enzyme required for sulfatase activity